jgi:hypothetical protein
MLFVYPGPTDEGPTLERVQAMNKYNEELSRAGALLALDGLMPPSTATRLIFSRSDRPTVTDGPFTEAKELVGGYWIIQARSQDEAVEWASRAPINEGDVIEVRQVFEMEDHGPEVQAAWDEQAHP